MTLRHLIIVFFSLLILLSGLFIAYKIVSNDQKMDGVSVQEKQYKVVLTHYAQKEYENTIHLGENFIEKYPQSLYFADILLNIAQSYFQLRNYNKAIIFYKLLLEKFPDYKLKNYVVDKLDRATRYKSDFVLSLELGLGGVQSDFEKCKELFDEKRYQEAFRALTIYLKHYPNGPFASSAEFLIADSYFNLSNFDLASKLFQQVINKYPQSEERYLANRRLEKIASLQNKKDNSSLEEIYKKALNNYYQKKYDSAIEEFSDFITLYPQSDLAPNCQYWLAESYYSLDKKSEALFEFEKVLKDYPQSSKVEDAKIKIKMIADARKSSNSSQDFQEYKNIRKAYLVGRYDKAIEAFDQYLSKFPQSKYIPNVYYWKGECCYSLEEYNKAIAVFEQILALFPDSEKADHAKVKIGMSKKKMGIVETSPQEALYKKSYGMYENKLFEESIVSFKDYMQKFPTNALVENCLYWIGECYYAMEDYNTAKSYFSQSMERYPSGNKSKDAKIKYEMSQKKLGEKVKSSQELSYDSIYKDFQETNYDRAISRGKEFIQENKKGEQSEKIMFLVAKSYEQSRKFDQALVEYKKIVQEYPAKAVIAQTRVLELCTKLDRPLQGKIERRILESLQQKENNR